MGFKIGDWVTAGDGNHAYTFVIAKIGDYTPGGSTHSDTGYFDMWWDGVLTYHCRKATQEEIEKACKEMIELESK